VQESDEI